MNEKQAEWETIAEQLPQGWRELADDMKLIQPHPAHIGAKITDIEQALRLVLYHVSGASLRLTTAVGAAAGLVAISAVALHKWMKKLGPYLAVLLQRMVNGAAFAPERWAGFDVIAGDATTVQRPGSKGTTARVHYALRLADLSARHIEVTDDKGGETARRFHPLEGELWLLDRAYANPPGIAWMRNQRAHVIVRYSRGSLPVYDAKKARIDVDSLLQSTPTRGIANACRAHVHGPDGEIIEGRLCWLRLPEEEAERARERLRRDADRVCDDAALHAAEFIIVFTTTGVQHLSAHQVLELYSARWQIELEFKRNKTIGELDRLPNFLPETIYSWICAKLLLQQIVRKIASSDRLLQPKDIRITTLPAVAHAGKPVVPCGRRAMVCDEVRLSRRMRGIAAVNTPGSAARTR